MNPLLVCESRIHESVVIVTELEEQHNSTRVASYLFQSLTLSQQLLAAPSVTKGSAKEVETTNLFEDIGCSLLHRIANNCNETTSDGTTTATVIAPGFEKEGIMQINWFWCEFDGY